MLLSTRARCLELAAVASHKRGMISDASSGFARPFRVMGVAAIAALLFAGAGQAQTARISPEQAVLRATALIAGNAAGHAKYCREKAEQTKAAGPERDGYIVQCEAYGAKTEARRSCLADATDNGLIDAERRAFANTCMAAAGYPEP